MTGTPIEGPRRCSSDDVAAAFAATLGRPVEVAVTPCSQWRAAYRKFGFCGAAADAYARMTAVSVDGGFEIPETAERGSVTLEAYVRALVGTA